MNLEPMDSAECEALAHLWREDMHVLRGQLQHRLNELDPKNYDNLEAINLLGEFEETIGKILEREFKRDEFFTERLWLKAHSKFPSHRSYQAWLSKNKFDLIDLATYEQALKQINNLPDDKISV